MADDTTISEQEQKRRRRERRLLLILFNPYDKIKRQMDEAERKMATSFKAQHESLSPGDDDNVIVEKLAPHKKHLHGALFLLLQAGMIAGFVDASRLTNLDVNSYAPGMRKRASQWADEGADSINRFTYETLARHKDDDNFGDGFILSDKRARRAARFSGTAAYYEGVRQNLGGRSKEIGKGWITGGPAPCETCVMNEDSGIIPMDEYFPSGDYAPLAHPSCCCFLGLRRL